MVGSHVNIASPFPKTWWVNPRQLLAGCYPGDVDPREAKRKLSALLEIGIRRFICLQPADEPGRDGKVFDPYLMPLVHLAQRIDAGISWLRFPIPDMGVPEERFMRKILDCIDHGVERDEPVCVHCWGGHGRTGAVIGCWLVRHGMGADEALQEISRLRQEDPHLQNQVAPQTDEQRAIVQGWDRQEKCKR